MQRWSEQVYQYIETLTRFNDPLLLEMEQRAKQDGFPIIGPLVGPYLYHYAQLLGAKRVFELGSGFGYSTWYFATALMERGAGQVTHTVWDESLSADAKKLLERAGLSNYCRFIVDEAVAALKGEEPGIDIVFMDVDKEGYPQALDVIKSKLRQGGVLLVDNVLWDGKVLDASDESEATRGVVELNRILSRDPDWEYLINPLRDGLAIARLR